MDWSIQGLDVVQNVIDNSRDIREPNQKPTPQATIKEIEKQVLEVPVASTDFSDEFAISVDDNDFDIAEPIDTDAIDRIHATADAAQVGQNEKLSAPEPI